MELINNFLKTKSTNEIKKILPNVSDNLLISVYNGNSKAEATLFEKIQIAKIKKWVNNLTISDFEIVTGLLITGFNTKENRQKAEDIYKNKGLRTMTNLEINELKSGDWFIIDSKLAKTKLCLVQKTKKSHKILCELADKSNFNNFSWGYFAIPDRSYL